ncbi:DNA-methyltransferase [Mucispirillum schaedleri]|jgi:DNA modification methylase|uniref:Methyltransferase n=1 Tax=Mucispirillum schaedleri ASF457 TaxID=1379858 RepID=V2QDH8_9BACT|nr:site-specific DNA-methyltransferase [Mucispirillum schaedleri]MCX4360667.1 site-specific DNA-methyltransferase [Mucispirillum schaedleri]USF23778.1 hypothetical protein N508_000845 [Mucispirillum schaedleri ASF457]SIW06693.1 conserved hypothetical protein [Mucispirillum schaedleri ASF457]
MEKDLLSFSNDKLSVDFIKKLGVDTSEDILDKLILLYAENNSINVRREIVSSIGRQSNKDKIYIFIKDNIYNCGIMELVYQMFRTCLYNSNDDRFLSLQREILEYFDNEILYKMKAYYDYRHTTHSKKNIDKIKYPILLEGDNTKTLKKIKDQQVQLIFSSPPYYNARDYSVYTSYKSYMNMMKQTLVECYRVLEDGRFIIINVSPIITKRPGREFESTRYPIHFDFHKILEESGFYFVDEIIWIKPEYSVPNRVGGYHQTRQPLSYKPNCITESLLVYRKKVDFLLDKNISKYPKKFGINDSEKYDTTNCWYINPKSHKEHPAVFPDELCEKVLTYYSFPNDVVLDMFAGSGTFGRVALQMGRIPILCEQNKSYIEIIKQGYNYGNI